MNNSTQWRLPVVLGVLLTVIALQCGVALAQPAPQLDLPREQLSFGVHRIEVQVAATPERRQTGLMMRPQMPQQEGMLFVFDKPAVQCFWMKNTLLPLTAAFIGDDGTVVNLADMQPQTTDSHCSTAPVRYVLEMNRGWFAARRIAPGFKVNGARFSSVPAKQ